MKSLFFASSIASVLALVGCGSPNSQGTTQVSNSTTPAVQNDAGSNANNPPTRNMVNENVVAVSGPSESVVQFLDAIRAGNDEVSNGLLSDEAKRSVAAANLELSPPGSPQAKYQVGETRFMDAEQDTALVETIWSEPNELNELVTMDVVWAVRLENTNWRITGMVVDMGAENPPEVIDFENLPGSQPERVASLPNAGQNPGMAPPTQNFSSSGGTDSSGFGPAMGSQNIPAQNQNVPPQGPSGMQPPPNYR